MKACVLRSYGAPECLEVTDVDTPAPAADEVLVRVRAASINPYDWHLMRGEPRIVRLMSGAIGLRAPKIRILGCDIAGQVEAVGKDVTEFRPGDDVFALLEHGGFAQYVCAPERLVARKPDNLSYEEAAAVPMAAVTALIGLRDVARIEAGQHVLVNGASGGVGSFAVQLARALGARVDAVCSAANVDLVRSIGAEAVVDYAKEDFSRTGRRYDALLDIAGSRPASACLRAVERRGTLVLIGGPPGRWLQPAGHVFGSLAIGPFVSQRITIADTTTCKEKNQILTTLATLIEEGKITPVIARRYPFDEIREAVRYQEQGHAPGKVVVAI
jgi:NADPH:quinone reductase-like Zn-dependent oxidoreductase